jgi:hypothetical protein
VLLDGDRLAARYRRTSFIDQRLRPFHVIAFERGLRHTVGDDLARRLLEAGNKKPRPEP